MGRVKLYNKTVEAHLNYPLTRLELTLDPATAYDDISFPLVYAIHAAQIGVDEFKATDTERFILGALLNGYGSLNMLGRKTRAKMEHFLELYVQRVEISKSEYAAILSQLYRYTQGRIDAATDGDQPPPKRLELPAWVQEIIDEEKGRRLNMNDNFDLTTVTSATEQTPTASATEQTPHRRRYYRRHHRGDPHRPGHAAEKTIL